MFLKHTAGSLILDSPSPHQHGGVFSLVGAMDTGELVAFKMRRLWMHQIWSPRAIQVDLQVTRQNSIRKSPGETNPKTISEKPDISQY